LAHTNPARTENRLPASASPDPLTDIIALVPVKLGPDAKTRLETALPERERSRVMRGLVAHTLRALTSAGISHIHLVARTEDAATVEDGWPVFRDAGLGPNAAIQAAAETLVSRGSEPNTRDDPPFLLVIAADLPLLGADDVALVARLRRPGRLVLAPDRSGAGTNAVLAPVGGLTYRFGPGSLRLHAEQAHLLGWDLAYARSVGLAADLDEPWDLDLARSFLQ
jgi:2-phospho-L-lactate guanylyltransferase